MGVRAEPSLICTLPGACGLSSLRDEVRALPGGWTHFPVTGDIPGVCACSLSFLRDEVHTVPGRVAGWRGDWSCCCRGIPQSAPKHLFLFGKILWLPPYKEGPVLSHSPSLQLDRGLSRSGSHRAQLSNFQLSSASPCGLPGFTTLSLFPSLRLQATRSLTVLLRPCLAAEGAINLALSQESCSRPSTCGPGAAAVLVPALVPGTFLS